MPLPHANLPWISVSLFQKFFFFFLEMELDAATNRQMKRCGSVISGSSDGIRHYPMAPDSGSCLTAWHLDFLFCVLKQLELEIMALVHLNLKIARSVVAFSNKKSTFILAKTASCVWVNCNLYIFIFRHSWISNVQRKLRIHPANELKDMNTAAALWLHWNFILFSKGCGPHQQFHYL